MLGTLLGLFSAVVYTVTNICLRSVTGYSPVWVSAVKAVPTAAIMLPWVVWNFRTGRQVFPAARVWAMIAGASLVGQMGGNISFQWALGEIGVALTVPLALAGMIVTASLMGRVFLGEPITMPMAISLVMLLAAAGVLSLGAEEARQSVAASAVSNPWHLAAGVGVACFSGLAYSVLNVVIRYSVQHKASLPGTLLTISVMGMLSLGSLSLWKIGLAGMAATQPADLAMMLLAGICNAIAFAALTKSLHLTSIVYVNILNATQATLAAVAGVVFFHEPASWPLVVGGILTIVGLVCMRQRKKRPESTVQ